MYATKLGQETSGGTAWSQAGTKPPSLGGQGTCNYATDAGHLPAILAAEMTEIVRIGYLYGGPHPVLENDVAVPAFQHFFLKGGQHRKRDAQADLRRRLVTVDGAIAHPGAWQLRSQRIFC